MISKGLCLSLLLLFYANFTFAEWRRLSGGDGVDYTQYVDFDTLKITDDGKFRIWELMDYGSPKISTKGERVRSSKTYWEIECKDFKHKVLTGSWFTGQMGKGESMGIVREGEYGYIQPGSIGSFLASPLCTTQK